MVVAAACLVPSATQPWCAWCYDLGMLHDADDAADRFEEAALRAEGERESLRAIVAVARCFDVGSNVNPGAVRIEKRTRGDEGWSALSGADVACLDGTLEYEPQPSSRDDDFLARTRFDLDTTCDVALLIEGVDVERVENIRRVAGWC